MNYSSGTWTPLAPLTRDGFFSHDTSPHFLFSTMGPDLVEREMDAKLVLLALLSKGHVLLVGDPGTAKSVLGSRLSLLCVGGHFFQRLLTRFSTPDELFGPLSLVGLERDEYRRVTKGFLPEASVAFLDELFKANSAILNTLLTILNERKFHNGTNENDDDDDCALQCVIGASNELPENAELAALYDRFSTSPTTIESILVSILFEYLPDHQKKSPLFLLYRIVLESAIVKLIVNPAVILSTPFCD